MRIELDLSKHCIATEMRRLYNRAVSKYFKTTGVDKPRLEQQIEALRWCLATMDFGRLRSTHKALAGGTDAAVTLEAKGTLLELAINGNLVLSLQRHTTDIKELL